MDRIGRSIPLVLLVVSWVILSTALPASAQWSRYQLGIGSARSCGMGEMTTILDEGTVSVWYNPAMSTFDRRFRMDATRSKLASGLGGEVWGHTLAAHAPLDGNPEGWACGAGYAELDIEQDAFNSGYEVIGKSRHFGRFLNVAVSGSPLEHLSLGGAYEYTYFRDWTDVDGSEIDPVTADAHSISFGAAYRPVYRFMQSEVAGLMGEQREGAGLFAAPVVGASFLHLGTKMDYDGLSYDLPRQLHLGAGLRFGLDPGRSPGGLDLLDFCRADLFAGYEFDKSMVPSDDDIIHHFGAELRLAGIASGRIGWIEDREGFIKDWTYGAGIGIEDVLPFGLRVDWASVPQAEDLPRVTRWEAMVSLDPEKLGFWETAPVSSAPRTRSQDLDGDGVPNAIDVQPPSPPGNTIDYRGVARDGDADGVPDDIDLEPDTPPGGWVDEYGRLIDSDHDRVDDHRDRCPETPIECVVDSVGCPREMTTIEQKLVDVGQFEETRIYFATGLATLQPESFPHLDRIGLALSELPELRFEVRGHCDERGTDAFNQELSERRARAVIDYLVRRHPGLSGDHFTPVGYGKKQPVATGTGEVSRAMNRRVEFVVLNPEAARAQIQTKRCMRRGEEAPGNPVRD